MSELPDKPESEAAGMAVKPAVEAAPLLPAHPAPPARVRQRRPEGVILVAIYHFLVAFPFLLAGLIILAIPVPAVILSVDDVVGLTAALMGLGIAVFFTAGFGVLYVLAGVGILALRNWARWLAVALNMLGLLCIPIGTVISAVILAYLLSPEVRRVFVSE